MPVPEILNVSAYKFVSLDDCEALRERLLRETRDAQLRGTILLAAEGINLFLAGPALPLRRFLENLQSDPRLANLPVKESWSDTAPFRRMLVKVKREIIRMNHPTIQPQSGRAPAVDAATVRRWLDQGHDDAGRPVVTLDTRNAFEVDAGTFEGAIDWRLSKFSDFPAAVQAHLSELQGKTVVSFCTGGIRCEKAAIYLREAGLRDVWQLEGGILRYFEEVGGAHYRGHCFVFDDRRAVNEGLGAVQA